MGLTTVFNPVILVVCIVIFKLSIELFKFDWKFSVLGFAIVFLFSIVASSSEQFEKGVDLNGV